MASTRYIGFTLLELLRVVAKPALLVDAVTADRVLSGLLEVEDRTDSLLLELSSLIVGLTGFLRHEGSFIHIFDDDGYYELVIDNNCNSSKANRLTLFDYYETTFQIKRVEVYIVSIGPK